MIQTLEWTDQGVRFIDQTKLPTEEVYVNCTTHQQVADVIRNMVVLNDGTSVTENMLPTELLIDRHSNTTNQAPNLETSPLRFLLDKAHMALAKKTAIKPLEDVIRETVEAAVEDCDGSIPRAAAALDVSPSTLYRRIEAWRIENAA